MLIAYKYKINLPVAAWGPLKTETPLPDRNDADLHI